MTSALAAAPHHDAPDPLLEQPVRDFMTRGCVVISQAASVGEVAETMAAQKVHAILVVGARNGTPLGWVTHRGLLSWVGQDSASTPVTDAITEQVQAIRPDEPIRTALYALSLSGTTRLLVRTKPDQAPEGVLSDFDLAVVAGR